MYDIFFLFQAMAVAGLTPEGHQRDMDYPSVQRTPMSSPHRVRSSYTQPGNTTKVPGCVAQSVGHLTRKSGVLGSIPGLATYFRFSFRFFKKGSCQLLAKVCARSTG